MKENPINRKVLLQELAEGLSRRKGISKKEADAFLRVVFEVIERYLESDKIVKIKGFGTFKLVSVESRESVNVNTGERIRIKGHTKISFTPDAVMRDQVNKPFAEFETVVLNEGIDLAEMERVDAAYLEDLEEEPAETGILEAEAAENSARPVDEPAKPQLEPEPMEEEPVALPVEDSDDEPEKAEEEAPEPEVAPDALLLEEESLQEVPDDEERVKEVKPNDEEESPSSSREAEEEVRIAAPVEGVTPTVVNIENQQTDYQKVEEQTVAELKVDAQHVAHQTIEHQNIVQEHAEGAPSKGLHLSYMGLLALALFVLLLMVGSYFAGYYQLLCPCRFGFLNKPTEVEVVQPEKPLPPKISRPVVALDSVRQQPAADTVSAPLQKPVESAQPVPVPRKDTVKAVTPAKKQPDEKVPTKKKAPLLNQVPQGKYVIVGTRKTHVVSAGETLRNIALEEYGSKGYARYIVAHNHITDPNTIQEGQILKLPELRVKEE